MFRDGKVALVTGAGSGIGRATALRFSVEGCRVALIDKDRAAAEATKEMIRPSDPDAIVICMDVASEEDVRSAIDQIRNELGRLDFAFNNAGVGGLGKRLHEHSLAEFATTLDVNLTGVFLCMKYELELMLAQNQGGAIVNAASALGLVGLANVSAYVASKHGVVGLTRAAAADYAPLGIRVNCICPGHIATGLNVRFWEEHPEAREWMLAQLPVGRFGTPEEVASAVMWLCSEEASFVHGHAFAVDGGMTIV